MLKRIGQILRRLPVVRELIGRTARTSQMWRNWWNPSTPTVDVSRRDYAFWDRARQCKTAGLELSGMFLKPLASKVAAWVQGDIPRFGTDSPKSQVELTKWWQAEHAQIMMCAEDSAALGDCYIVVNPDLTTTVLPPDVVTPIVSEADFSEIIGWRVREVYPHPDNPLLTMAIENEYYADRRVRTIWKTGAEISRQEFVNLIGRIPVIHVPNNKGSNAVFGEPEGVAMLPALIQYGATLDHALRGNRNQSTPTPVAEFDDANAMAAWYEQAKAIGLVGTQTINHADGSTETFDEVNLVAGNFVAMAGAKFDYKNPGSFAGDTKTLLELLFYLILQYTEIPEFAWGNAIASSKASAETQLLPFLKWIEKKRVYATGWMLELAQVALAFISLSEPGVMADETITIVWPPLTDADGKVTLDALKWMLSSGLIDDLTAIQLAPVDIADPAATLETARKEVEDRAAANRDPAEIDFEQFANEEMRRQGEADDSEELERAA